MKITGPFRDKGKRDQKKPWYLRVSVPKKNPDGTVVLVDGRAVLKRWRPYYKTKAKAEEDKPAIAAQFGSAGASTGGGVVTRAQASEFESAKALVPEASLVDVAKFWRMHHPLESTARVRELAKRFEEAVKKRIGATAHWEDLKSRTGIFVETFGDRIPETITRKEVMTWLESFPGGAKSGRTVLNLKQAVCNFFNWLRSLEEGIMSHNPAGGIKKRHLPKIAVKEIGFFSLEDSERYLRALERYDPDLIAHEIIQLLSGVRADDEMKNFRGDWVLPQTREIVIPAAIAKTGKREVIAEIEAVFWEWWAVYGRKGILRPANYRHRWMRVRVLSLMSNQAEADELARQSAWSIARSAPAKASASSWPWNARRRTFVTFHVAKHQSAALTALIIRHRGDTYTLHDSYRGTGVTQTQGVAYFDRRPLPVQNPLGPPHSARAARGIVKFRLEQQKALQASA